MHPLHRLACAVAVLPGLAATQATWSQLVPPVTPGVRSHVGAVSDGGGLLVFGGKPGGVFEQNDLWRFDGTRWFDITPAGTLPPPRDLHAAAWDSGRGRYVVFGGRSGSVIFDDTWEYDGATWSRLQPALSPSPRQAAAMVFDPVRGVCVLFGGEDATGSFLDETWSWDGTTWAPLTTIEKPGPRARAAFSWDSLRDEGLLYGGTDGVVALGDTWRWTATGWVAAPTATMPGEGNGAGLLDHGMTFDPARDRHVLFGGTTAPGGTPRGETWEFDGIDWIQRVVAGPPPRTGAALAYVSALESTVAFGGFGPPRYSDTWEFRSPALARAESFGTGCAGSGGGTLTLHAETRPWLGESFSATATRLAPNSLPFRVLGFSSAAWQGGMLPVPLDALHPSGMPTCTLLTSLEDNAELIAVSGSAHFTLTIPPLADLAGTSAFLQVLEIEFSGPRVLALHATNGLHLTLGAR